ncbi:MAG: methylenetetrahydrofolate dehydrogenase (NADP+) / methenyltetrahydrofolate cyclohydrolase [Verrucomicrobia bacterium]|jgi:methylenetetrahydrofolate dehydrogenase (NADP+)/methenyltetrahydrofolate cyclohydrolase|nr:MAG: methylenetetrahydrofolate dehydrogenase (NADP+) / methenyltetrahydrofolate cyclohydrolase [Verrucomicrobiota bacterium]
MTEPFVIRGADVAADVYRELSVQLEAFTARGVRPGLAVILVGDDPASKAYVASKDRKCRELGFYSLKLELPASTQLPELLAEIEKLNRDPAIHGILVQMPLPRHLDEQTVIRAIDPRKDVDGLHPMNLGKLVMEDPTGFAPCTPSGCQRMLQFAGVATAGARVVVIGRSLLVGKSIALLLVSRGTHADATVTIAHSRTRELPALCREADILIAAIGKPNFVTADFVRDGAVVIDVGINRVPDPARPGHSKLIGDVAYEEVAPRCKAITPVPGGVGVMTIAMLMANTAKACGMTLAAL